MRAQEHRPALRPQREDQVANGLCRIRIEPGRGLIEENDLRLVERGTRDRDLLLHAARIRRDRVVTAIPESHQPQEMLDARDAEAVRQAVEAGVEVEVVVCREALV